MPQPELKIIADHLRSSCFLIADGVLPSNEGRGYVLRRIMRRAMRQIHKLGAKQATMHKLVGALIKEMGDAFPELSRARAVIVETLKNEEEKFRETLDKGLKILEEEITLISNHPNVILSLSKDASSPSLNKPTTPKLSGEIAFKLYDTYGFPLDLTQDILKEKNLEVDITGFNSEMEKQRERARKSWAGSGEEKEDKLFFELKEKFGETKFLGYETLQIKAKILFISPALNSPALNSPAPNSFIILDQTPFYATSGGQKGDDGKIFSDQGAVKISETKKFAGNLFVHFVSESEGQLKIGDEVIAEVNAKTRQMRARNHSATHLMHKALKEILGNSVSQKGSNVDAEYFTFDFNFNRAMTKEELVRLEDLVNFYIQQNSPVSTELMELEKARNSGAEALFGEKYDAAVRVLSMGKKEDEKAWSVELCGGTHVKATGDIGIFKVISENGIAAGIRRITAKSGFAVIEFQRQKENENEELVENLQQDLKKKDKEIERLKRQILFSGLENLKPEEINSLALVTNIFPDADAKDIREITNEVRTKKSFQNSTIFAFFGCKDDKVAICVAVSADLVEKFDSAKLIAPLVETLGGKGGGGKKDLAMGGGTNKNAIPQAIGILREVLKK